MPSGRSKICKTVVDAIRDGLTQLAKAPLDIVLMDLQYTPAVLVKEQVGGAYDMERFINEVAASASVPVNVFKRFDLMRRWHNCEKVSFDRMVDPSDPDRLHHSDCNPGGGCPCGCDGGGRCHGCAQSSIAGPSFGNGAHQLIRFRQFAFQLRVRQR
jgi:hypothetical protein